MPTTRHPLPLCPLPVRRPPGIALFAFLLASGCADVVAPTPPASVEIDVSAVSLGFVGDTARVNATVRDAFGNVLRDAQPVWHSADTMVATVTEDGLVRARAHGGTRITAAVAAASVSATVTVAAVPARIELSIPRNVLDSLGDTVRLVAAVSDAGGAPLEAEPEWSSSEPAIATIDAQGLVTGVAPGGTWIHARLGATADSVEIRVEPPLVLSPASADSLAAVVGARVALNARVADVLGAPEAGVPVRWEVDAGSLESPSETRSGSTGTAEAEWRLDTVAGLQRATASMETKGERVSITFTARAEPGPAATATLEADSVLLNGAGETALLAPALQDAYGNVTSLGADALSWIPAADGIVDVGPGGLVTGLSEGSTTVHAWVGGRVTDSIWIEVARRGAITLTFDDGWRSVHENAWPVIQDFPWLRANVGVYTEAVGWPGYLSEDHLDELHAAGWSMVSHTVSHDSLSTLSPGQLEAELRDSQAWLQARGYRGSDIFIAPYHDFTETERVAAAAYYRAARGASAHATAPETLVDWMPAAPHHLTGIPADDLPYTTVEGRDRLRTLLQRTADEGAFLDIFLHQVPVGNLDAFRALLEVLAEFQGRVLPYHELFPAQPRAVR